MREKIVYELNYREKGKSKKRRLEIDFVSSWVIREFGDMFNEIQDIKSRWDEANKLILDVAILRTEREEGWKEKSKEIEEQIEEIRKGIVLDYGVFDDSGKNEKGPSKHENKRYEIIEQLLEDNGIKEDDKLMNFTFWDKQVDPNDTINFLMSCCWKDVDEKKKMAV